MAYNNNPFDNVMYARKSHETRMGCSALILATGMVTLSVFLMFWLMNQEWFVHYVVHIPCYCLRDIRHVALNDDTLSNCSRCRDIKQRVINDLTPEERQIIKQRDQYNIKRAREAAESNLVFKREIEIKLKQQQEQRWKRDLGQ